MNLLTKIDYEVMVRGKKSITFLVISAVCQGLVLGPLLFPIFIGDISEGVSAVILDYVDDSKLQQRVKN